VLAGPLGGRDAVTHRVRPFLGVAADVSPLKSPPAKTGKKSEPAHTGCYEGKFYPLAAVEKMPGNASPDHNPKASAKLFHRVRCLGRDAFHRVPFLLPGQTKRCHLTRRAILLWRCGCRAGAAPLQPHCSPIPPEVFDYQLGIRSALEWVIDQYRVTRDEKEQHRHQPSTFFQLFIAVVVALR
jgi:hypothetical protein